EGDDLGYNARGMINIPLGETFAMLASGSVRRDPGFIDNVRTQQNDINQTDSQSVRLAGLWSPNEAFSLKLSALHQRTERNGAADAHLPPPVGTVPGIGDFEQSALIDTGWYDRDFQAYSATIKAQLGPVDLT